MKKNVIVREKEKYLWRNAYIFNVFPWELNKNVIIRFLKLFFPHYNRLCIYEFINWRLK